MPELDRTFAAATAPRTLGTPAPAPGAPAATTATPPAAPRTLLGFLGLSGGGGREAELSEQLESKESESLALQVQLANLKGALRSQEEMTRELMFQQAATAQGGASASRRLG